MHTICYQCGATKEFINEPCAECSFEPRSIDDLAKARILSEPYCYTTVGGVGFETGRSAKELEQIAGEIRKGSPYRFPPDELENVKQVLRDVESMTAMDVARDFARLVGPPFGLLAASLFILWLVRS